MKKFNIKYMVKDLIEGTREEIKGTKTYNSYKEAYTQMHKEHKLNQNTKYKTQAIPFAIVEA